MNPVVWAIATAATVLWLARPRPPARRPSAADRSDLTGVDDDSPIPQQRRRRSAGRRSRSPALPSGRRTNDRNVELAHWCESVARAVRGGDALRTAVDHTPAADSITAAVDAVRSSVDQPNIDQANVDQSDIGHRRDGPARRPAYQADTALVVAVVGACLAHGGPAAEPLDRAAGVLRARATERGERQVQSAQARLSATVLTWLPIVMLAVLATSSAAVRRVVASPLGATIVAAGAVLNFAGWWWMRTVVQRAAR